MNASSKAPVFQSRGRGALVKRRELWRLAHFIARHHDHEVRIEGVTSVRAQRAGAVGITAPPITATSGNGGQSMNTTPQGRPLYRFKKRGGIATLEDLQDYLEFLIAHVLPPGMSSGSFINASTAGGHRRVTLGPEVAVPTV